MNEPNANLAAELRETLEIAKGELSCVRDERGYLEEDLERARGDRDKAEARVANLESEIGNWKILHAVKTQDRDDWRARVAELEAQLDGARTLECVCGCRTGGGCERADAGCQCVPGCQCADVGNVRAAARPAPAAGRELAGQLKEFLDHVPWGGPDSHYDADKLRALDLIRRAAAALSRPQPAQEPAAWLVTYADRTQEAFKKEADARQMAVYIEDEPPGTIEPLYRAPPPQPGGTDLIAAQLQIAALIGERDEAEARVASRDEALREAVKQLNDLEDLSRKALDRISELASAGGTDAGDAP